MNITNDMQHKAGKMMTEIYVIQNNKMSCL